MEDPNQSIGGDKVNTNKPDLNVWSNWGKKSEASFSRARSMYVLEKKISSDLFVSFKSHASLKCWFQLSTQRASSILAAYQVHTHASIFHIVYITSTIFHYDWSISLKVIFLPLTCNGASSVSAPTDHYDGTGAIPRLVPWCANQGTTNAAQTDDEPTAAAKIRRTTTTVARLRGASNEECNFGLLALRQHRRCSTALYCSDWEQLIPTLRDLARGAHHQHRPTAF